MDVFGGADGAAASAGTGGSAEAEPELGKWGDVVVKTVPMGDAPKQTGILTVFYTKVWWTRTGGQLPDIEARVSDFTATLFREEKCMVRLPITISSKKGKGPAYTFKFINKEHTLEATSAIKSAMDFANRALAISNATSAAGPLVSSIAGDEAFRPSSRRAAAGRRVGELVSDSGDSDERARIREALLRRDQVLLEEFRREVFTGKASQEEFWADSERATLFENEKARFKLLEDPSIARLYKNLVENGEVSHDEFWDSRHRMVVNERVRASQLSSTGGRPVTMTSDDTPVSGSELPEDMMSQIFWARPAVQRFYIDQVEGGKLTHKEFWQRYFYLQKKRNKGRDDSDKGLGQGRRSAKQEAIAAFQSGLDQAEEAELQAQKEAFDVDRSDVDLTQTAHDVLRAPTALERGFGSAQQRRNYASVDRMGPRTSASRSEGDSRSMLRTYNAFGANAMLLPTDRKRMGRDASEDETYHLADLETREVRGAVPLEVNDQRNEFAAPSAPETGRIGASSATADAPHACSQADLHRAFSVDKYRQGRSALKQQIVSASRAMKASKPGPAIDDELFEDRMRTIFKANNDILFQFYKKLRSSRPSEVSRLHQLHSTLGKRIAELELEITNLDKRARTHAAKLHVLRSLSVPLRKAQMRFAEKHGQDVVVVD